ncbi:DNA -binding domain-containing protein [Sphingopyxis sp. R3-92]|uniref:DNA -binding domain-containing protein n=1 Tax=Sphingopyxis sp. R3-92 TaxID=3158553 RepID=UPI003EE45C39
MPPRSPALAPQGRFACSRGTGGWCFALDPRHSAADAPALWHPRACALVTIAAPSSAGFAAARLADIALVSGVAAEAIDPVRWHLVLAVDGRRYRLSIEHGGTDTALAYICAADDDAAARLAVASALHMGLSGAPGARPAACAEPGPTERWRLVQWLRLLDAHEAGASPREIAAALIPGAAQRPSASEWDASSERRRIGRWRKRALAMRDGGYLELLAAR